MTSSFNQTLRRIVTHTNAHRCTSACPSGAIFHAAETALPSQRRGRFLSTAPQSTPPPRPPPPPPPPPTVPPPTEINEEIAMGVQSATQLFIRHGLGDHGLKAIARDAGSGRETLVERWQKMMAAFLGTQVHVLAGLGYTPDEEGLGLYNRHLGLLMQRCDPETQESLRVAGRDTWREVLSRAFAIPLEDLVGSDDELSIVDARNVMHKVSERMQSPEVLQKIARECDAAAKDAKPGTEAAAKHMAVQRILVDDVYFGGGNDPNLLSECGFGSGESGYVKMQCVMAEHQSDPLCTQYIASAMMKIFETAGLDPGSMAPQRQEEKAPE